jgi:hypothetical protein
VKPLSKISSLLPSTSRYYKESPREAKPLFHNQSPFPLIRGRGIKGDEANKQPNKQHFARITNTDILTNQKTK